MTVFERKRKPGNLKNKIDGAVKRWADKKKREAAKKQS